MTETTNTTADVPTRFVLGIEYGGACLCCPVCGHEYVHPAVVTVDQGHIKTTSSHDTALVQPSDRHTRARGSEVRLQFWCEEGHEFSYRFTFHKGITTLQLDATDIDGWPQSGVNELWRD